MLNCIVTYLLHSQQIGDVKKSDLPGPDALSTPGKKEGQVLMIKATNGSVEAHQVRIFLWSFLFTRSLTTHTSGAPARGKKSAMSLMLSDRAENSSTKEKNTITSLMWIFKMAFLR